MVLSPQIADFSEMAKLVIMTVVGGLGTFAGPLIGAAPIQILNSYLAKYGEWDMVIYAARGDRADARQHGRPRGTGVPVGAGGSLRSEVGARDQRRRLRGPWTA